MEFYTNVNVRGSKILYRGIKDGKRIQAQLPYSPTLYTKYNEQTGIKSLYGDNLKPIQFKTVPEARDFLKERKDVSNGQIYGNNQWQYAWIAENYKGEVPFNYEDLNIVSLDIETTVEGGFPDPAVCAEEVLLITMMDFRTKKMVTLGSRPSKADDYILCADEDDLLRTFVRTIKGYDPDIITGWNVSMFDIAYLFTRIKIRLGEEVLESISPWNSVRKREISIADFTDFTYSVEGIAILDLLDLYRKFTFVSRESYKLDHIAEVELGENKLEMPCDTFKEFYRDHWETFVEYNKRDVELVDKLEVKLGLIYLATTLAYISKVNYDDVFSPVKTWTCYIKSALLDENTHTEITGIGNSDDGTIVGAYVKEPVPGFYDWVASFDATSLYPSIIMMLNMSPEKIVGKGLDCSPEKLLTTGLSDSEVSMLKENNYALSANGMVFKKDSQGIMPRLTESVFSGRKIAKKRMLEAKQKYIDTGNIEFKKEADRQGVIQQALKVNLNSLYGAMANKYFPFYDTRIAEGITLTGQYIIQKVRDVANARLQKMCESTTDFAFYCDTDSVYLTLKPLVDKFFASQSREKLIDLLDKTCDKKISAIFKEGTDSIHSTLNAFSERIDFKREAIADRGFWVAKKKYALRVWDNEGVRYETPEMKVLGIEIVRSSTPASVRGMLKSSLKYIMDGDLSGLREHVEENRQKFNMMEVKDIAFPRSANNLLEYSNTNTIYRKGCPQHVRGVLVYNNQIKNLKLEEKYVTIKEGDKIKFTYLKMPNRVRENTIAFIDRLPKEFGLDTAVDYDTQWEKAFLSPINIIMNAVGWQLVEKSSLEDFFG